MLSLTLLCCCFFLLILEASCQCPRADGFYPQSTHCDRYYQCKTGQVVREGVCPDGLVFSNKPSRSRTPKCVFPFGVDCRDRSSTQPAQPSPNCPRKNGYYRDPGDCRKFFICDDGRPFNLDCPAGLAYDEFTGTCNWPDQVDGCSSEDIVNFVCPTPTEKELQEFGDPRYSLDDCQKFVVCVESESEPGKRLPRLLGCEPGMVFNPAQGICDDPQLVPRCSQYARPSMSNQLRRLARKIFGF